MKNKVSFERAVYFTKLSVYLAFTWPPPKIATKWETFKYDVLWLLSVISGLCLLIPLFRSIYVYKENSVIVTQSTCFVCGGSNVIVKTIVYRIHRKRMQVLIHEMENFLKTAKNHERLVLESYMNRCMAFHAVLIFMNYVTAFAMIAGPLVFPQPLPTLAIYPFSVDKGIVKYLIYIHQSITGLTYSSAITSDCQIALLMWFASARLEMLAGEVDELKDDATDSRNFQYFVRKHEKLLWYASETSNTMSYIAMTTSTLNGLATIMSSIQLVSNQPFAMKIQYGPMVVIAMMNLFVTSWAAENLLRVCDLMGTTMYNTSWINASTVLMKDFLVVIRRCQRPVIVSIGGFIPKLSLRFYASFLSSAFSYFTTLRIAMMENEE